jgi:integrase
MLTDLLIKKLALPEKRREVPDGKIGGLYLVVQPSGAKSWALRYRVDGVPKKLTIGAYPAIDLATARKRAQEAMGDVAGGKDPAAIKRASRGAARAEREAQVDRVERVAEMFIERHAKPKTRDWRETERMLDKEVVGRWRGRRLSQITRAHVHEMLDEIIDRGAPIRANRVFAQLRKVCRWALSRGIIERSPCEGMTAPSAETRRDRVLSDDEIRLVWQAFELIGWPFGPIGKLLLLTGARRDEVASMEWRELDTETRTWTLPAARSKNKRPHEIPLSDAAAAIIAALPHVEGNAGFVFSTTGRTPVSGFSRAKTAMDATILELMRAEAEAAGADPADVKVPERWTLHDLRRTVATNLQKLGVRLEVTEAVLNHVSGSRAGIVGVYQRHTYTAEKRQALDAWARRLAVIVKGGAPAQVLEFIAKARA